MPAQNRGAQMQLSPSNEREKKVKGVCVCVGGCGCVPVSEGARNSSSNGAEASGVLCPGTSSWGDWDPGAVTRLTECLSPPAGGTHAVHMLVYIFPSTDPCTYMAKEESQETIYTYI